MNEGNAWSFMGYYACILCKSQSFVDNLWSMYHYFATRGVMDNTYPLPVKKYL